MHPKNEWTSLPMKKAVSMFAAAVSFAAFLLPSFGAENDWKTYTKLNSGLAGNNVAAIALDPDGENVWFGSGEDILFTGLPGSRGVSRYNTSTDNWTSFSTADGLAHNSVFSIEIDDRIAWFGTRKGISRFEMKTGVWTSFDSTNSVLEESVIRQIKLDRESLWIITNRGKVYRHTPSRAIGPCSARPG
jgi:ligand-binding sensor domain-containing protein